MSKMIAEPERYFRTLVAERDPVLEMLEKEAHTENIPIVGPVIGALLFVTARFAGARRVLEFGTATGYSAIWLARGCGSAGAQVLSLEKSPVLADRARRNCDLAGVADTVDPCLITVPTRDIAPAGQGVAQHLQALLQELRYQGFIFDNQDLRTLHSPGSFPASKLYGRPAGSDWGAPLIHHRDRESMTSYPRLAPGPHRGAG